MEPPAGSSLTLIPQALGLTIPMATLVGILIGLGRLSADREAVALLACGVSPYRLLRPILAFAPGDDRRHRLRHVRGDPGRQPGLPRASPGTSSRSGSRTTSSRGCSSTISRTSSCTSATSEAGGGWKDVLVADTTRPEPIEVIMAARGRLVLDREKRRVDLVLSDGTRYLPARKGESQAYRFHSESSVVARSPNTVFGRQEIPRTVTEKTHRRPARRLAGQAQSQGRGALAAPGNRCTSSRSSRSRRPASSLRSSAWRSASPRPATARWPASSSASRWCSPTTRSWRSRCSRPAATTGRSSRPAACTRPASSSPTSRAGGRTSSWGSSAMAALVWRARFAHRGLPVTLPVRMPRLVERWLAASRTAATPLARAAAAAGGDRRRQDRTAARKNVIVVIRLPRLRLPGPGPARPLHQR